MTAGTAGTALTTAPDVDRPSTHPQESRSPPSSGASPRPDANCGRHRQPVPRRRPGQEITLVRAGSQGAVCGIRYTPGADTITSGGTYYEWIRNGFALYEALAAVAPAPGWQVIEVFPTASWTRLYKPRGSARRAAWSRLALDALQLDGVPTRRLNQDDRDAIAAAWTARLRSQAGGIEWFGDIAAPAITTS